MANFLVLSDPDPGRRARVGRLIEPRLAPVAGLLAGSLAEGDTVAWWTAAARTPLGTWREPGAATVIWGRPFNRTLLSAQALGRDWRADGDHPRAYDGYFVAASWERERHSYAADVLGLFPVWYAHVDDVLIVASSPELFACHPSFPLTVDLGGLVDTLLALGPLDGGGLVRGVRRLAAGDALTWRPGAAPVLSRQYRIPADAADDGEPLSALADRLYPVLMSVVEREVPPGEAVGLLLSGGRDSRLLAGVLRELGRPVRAITLGRRGDYEWRAASSVARATGARHQRRRADAARFPELARIQITSEHLSGGLNFLTPWLAMEALREAPALVVSGYFVDAILSGRASREQIGSFETWHVKLNRRAIPVAAMRRLLRPAHESLVDATLDRWRALYAAMGDSEDQARWRFQLAYSERSYVGIVPWRLSFGAWPVVPVLDRALLDVVGRLPGRALVDRAVEDALLARHFPDLARLPVVQRNARLTSALEPPGDRAVTGLRAGAEVALSRMWDRRFGHRTYDVNGPGWRAVRAAAEPYRDRLAALFRMDAVNAQLPAPAARIVVGDAILDGHAPKLLAGLMLWLADHSA